MVAATNQKIEVVLVDREYRRGQGTLRHITFLADQAADEGIRQPLTNEPSHGLLIDNAAAGHLLTNHIARRHATKRIVS